MAEKAFSEADALRIACCVLQENQRQFFDYDRVRRANRDWLAKQGTQG